MTSEQIMNLALQSGFTEREINWMPEVVERFGHAVAAAQRQECVDQLLKLDSHEIHNYFKFAAMMLRG